MTSSSITDVLQLVIGYALDPRSNQRLQRIEIRNSIQLRHLWILRRIHIPSERHTGPHAAVAWFGGDKCLSLDNDLTFSFDDWIWL